VLLLSIDPLASLAETQEQLHQRLLDLTPVDAADSAPPGKPPPKKPPPPPSPLSGEGSGVRAWTVRTTKASKPSANSFT
jgi:hypothetical protein